MEIYEIYYGLQFNNINCKQYENYIRIYGYKLKDIILYKINNLQYKIFYQSSISDTMYYDNTEKLIFTNLNQLILYIKNILENLE